MATFDLQRGKREVTEAAVRLLRQAGPMRLYSAEAGRTLEGAAGWRLVGDLADDVELAARTLTFLSEGNGA